MNILDRQIIMVQKELGISDEQIALNMGLPLATVATID